MTTRPANNRVQAVTSQQAVNNENARLKQQVDELRQQLAQMMHSPPPASPPIWTATTPDVTTHMWQSTEQLHATIICLDTDTATNDCTNEQQSTRQLTAIK